MGLCIIQMFYSLIVLFMSETETPETPEIKVEGGADAQVTQGTAAAVEATAPAETAAVEEAPPAVEAAVETAAVEIAAAVEAVAAVEPTVAVEEAPPAVEATVEEKAE